MIEELHQGIDVITGLVGHIDDESARWRESPNRWSLVEIVAHLADEEREDFRTRTMLTLASPETTWPPIDPQGWITSRNYQEKSLATCLDDFRAERTASLQQLRSLNDPDWSSTHQHPLGPTTATFMLANWVAHDLHHIRQIVGWRYHNLDQATDGLPLVYAGEW